MVLGRRNATVPAQYEIDQATEESSGRLVQQTVGKTGASTGLQHFTCTFLVLSARGVQGPRHGSHE